MREEDKIKSGQLFSPGHPDLAAIKLKTHNLNVDYNQTYENENEKREQILREILGHLGTDVRIQGPIAFHYGIHTSIGDHVFVNFNFTVQDDAEVTIGDYNNFGPNCTIVTPVHPMVASERRMMINEKGEQAHLCYAKPVKIGNDNWFGANVVICPGVTIGDNCVIGAGSVVTRDIPSNSFAAGVPCRVIREITEADSMAKKPEILGDNRVMEYQIIQINSNTWRIEDGGVRFFLLTGTEKALLIDSGMMVNNAKEIAEALTDLPVSLLNTHADRDHIGSNEQFENFFIHPEEESLYRSSGKPGRIIPIQEGDTIDLGNRELKIIGLPGHTPGSIAVLDVAARVLISGDPIQRHGRIFMFGPHRNMDMYIKSLEQLEKRKSEFDEIWPSHADIPITTDTIKMLHDGAEEILAGKVTGKPEEMFGSKITAYDLGFCTMLCDR